MLFRKIRNRIENHLKSDSNKIMIIEGARQIGKSYIIREVGKSSFENYIEINLLEDSLGNGYFANVKTVSDFYLQVSMIAGSKMKEKSNTLIFLDEIQAYPHLLTLLKFLSIDNRYTYIASGSQLGITLSRTTSIPIGSITITRMFPLDFEEFLYANGFNEFSIATIKEKFTDFETPDEALHNRMIDLFKKYILTGGLPDSINSYLKNFNIAEIRQIQDEIHDFYAADASRYDAENKLKIRRIYDMIPSTLENKKKRIVAKNIENIKGKRYSDYVDEFDYLINSGIALEVKAISTPVFPLIESSVKNLLKLYLNDVGILSSILYKTNIRAILDNELSVNLGTVYESVVASELIAHGHKLFYYDNRNKGEIDFLIDDYENLSTLPIEVKSGKDYKTHSALTKFLNNPDNNVKKGYVLSNAREIITMNNVIYLPIYFVMFL